MEEARCARSYRDEVEALRVRATRCDKLENDLVRYKQKVEDMEYLKKKIAVSYDSGTKSKYVHNLLHNLCRN